ncbi:MAG: hypothetical protein KDC54_07395 [Lewinella sp.]|nr:hypothetical protein [Lewinella sp.]
MKLVPGRKGEWGDFVIEASEGWIVSQAYLDHESGLLIVQERPMDTSNLPRSEHGITLVPNITYVIDKGLASVLQPEEWRARFNYDLIEYIVGEEGLKVVEQRIPSAQGNFDLVESKLIEVETGNILREDRRAGFCKTKPKTVYEKYAERKAAETRRKDKENSQLTLESFFHHEKLRLRFGQSLLLFMDSGEQCFRAKAGNGSEVVVESGGPKPAGRQPISAWKQYLVFDSVWLFWLWLNKEAPWHVVYRPFWNGVNKKVDNSILAYYIVHEANQVRYTTKLDRPAWSATRLWENMMDLGLVRKSEFIQVCPNCLSKVLFFPMYPTGLCGNCISQLTDIDGRSVQFSNVTMSGGCQGYYLDTKEKYDHYHCYIGDKKFYALEMKFGGVAVVPFEDRDELG